jgi:hypothetical protein
MHVDLVLGEGKFGPTPTIRLDDSFGVRHLLIAGTTGAGKSGWINGAVAACARSPLIQLVGFDPKAVELTPWAPRMAQLATTGDDSITVSQLVWRYLQHRKHIAAKRGWRTWHPTPTEPWLGLIGDELAQVFKITGGDEDPQARELWDFALHVGRALGVFCIGGTQQPSSKALGDSTEIRSLSRGASIGWTRRKRSTRALPPPDPGRSTVARSPSSTLDA